MHTIRVGREPNMGVFKEGPNTWERLPNGDYLLRSTGAPDDEFVIPAASVKCEKRPRSKQPEKAPK